MAVLLQWARILTLNGVLVFRPIMGLIILVQDPREKTHFFCLRSQLRIFEEKCFSRNLRFQWDSSFKTSTNGKSMKNESRQALGRTSSDYYCIQENFSHLWPRGGP